MPETRSTLNRILGEQKLGKEGRIMTKSVRLTKTSKAEAVEAFKARIEQERTTIKPKKTRPSTGADSKEQEVIIRDMINAEGITRSGDMRCRGINQDDCRVKDKLGNWIHVEIKHGGGSIAYADKLGMEVFEDRDRDLCLVGQDWVIYCVDASIKSRARIAFTYRVARRDDFLDMLEEYCHGPKAAGWETAVKFNNASHTAINIQSRYIKQFWAGLQDDPRSMSLKTWCWRILGRSPRWDW